MSPFPKQFSAAEINSLLATAQHGLLVVGMRNQLSEVENK
jgi:hypothetical protein